MTNTSRKKQLSVLRRLLNDGAFGITGIYGSPVSAKYLPMAVSHKLPVAGFYNGTYFVGEPVKKYVFADRASYRDEMHEAVDHLWNEGGFRKFASDLSKRCLRSRLS